jgi:hypothetical protein
MGGEVFEGKWCWVRAEGGAVAESERRYLLWLDVVVTQPTNHPSMMEALQQER